MNISEVERRWIFALASQIMLISNLAYADTTEVYSIFAGIGSHDAAECNLLALSGGIMFDFDLEASGGLGLDYVWSRGEYQTKLNAPWMDSTIIREKLKSQAWDFYFSFPVEWAGGRLYPLFGLSYLKLMYRICTTTSETENLASVGLLLGLGVEVSLSDNIAIGTKLKSRFGAHSETHFEYVAPTVNLGGFEAIIAISLRYPQGE